MHHRFPLLLVAVSALGVSLSVPSVIAGPVANWKELNPAAGHPNPLTGADTDGPTIGDGTDASAQASWVAGRFGTVAAPVSVTLEVGQTLTVSGNLLLTRGAGPNSDYRFGIFNDDGKFASNDGNGWVGGWLHQTGTDLYQGRTDGPYISSGGDALRLNAVKTSTGTLSKDSATPLAFSMSLTRDSATTLDIVSTISGGDGAFDQTYTLEDVTTTLFTYTSAGLLFGGVSALDQAVLSNVQYAISPDPTELRITKIVHTETADPANVIVSITFTSEENRIYTVYRSVDLDTPIEERTDVSDNVPAEAGSDTTTFDIDFNFYGIPLDTLRQFFVVQQNP